ncbi:MAG: RSP_7527 family protein [Beijerinckiaceae bacterium]
MRHHSDIQTNQCTCTQEPVLRRRDGSLDLQAYNHKANVMRSETLRGLVRWLGTSIRALFHKPRSSRSLSRKSLSTVLEQ